MAKPPNIVLLMADQHQADMLGCMGDGLALNRQAPPALRELAALRGAALQWLPESSVLVVDDFSATIVFDAGDLFAGHFVTLSLDRALNVHGRASLWG